MYIDSACHLLGVFLKLKKSREEYTQYGRHANSNKAAAIDGYGILVIDARSGSVVIITYLLYTG